MAKTETTLEIEQQLKSYAPACFGGIKVNKIRGRNIAFEVPVTNGTTKNGLIDAVEVSEYFGDVDNYMACRFYKRKLSAESTADCIMNYPVGEKPEICSFKECRNNVWKNKSSEKILIICYEIKVSKSDFANKNGHNFVGNLNYYVVPVDLYPQIQEKVPDGVGIIVYYDGKQEPSNKYASFKPCAFKGLRRKKECTFREMTDAEQKWLMLTVMKRIQRTERLERRKRILNNEW